ncbi:MAG: tRNA (adenosine(37)-N6)-dimethylallyltransferase MiaA [Elusimicrobia bacterium]|nr:tRNA (adenosine(37)-N6)-dimethylallyltransferase MiaA [Elusimicrobiota bacterium]
MAPQSIKSSLELRVKSSDSKVLNSQLTTPNSQLPIVILGPTASGKTELSIELAQKLDGEIISADSRQIYKYLDAGTAKPRRSPVPIHLIDFLDPRQTFNAGEYIRMAQKAFLLIKKKEKLPILSGGTGLYIQAFWNGLDPVPAGSPALRQKLEILAQGNGREKLYQDLLKRDPEAASKIHPRNTQRLIRALEVHELTGRPLSSYWTQKTFLDLPRTKALFIGLDSEKTALKERILKRSKNIFPLMLEEVRELLSQGYPSDCPGLKSLGYPEAVLCLEGKLNYQMALDRLNQLTWAYAKRQMTWFRRYKSIHWIKPNPRILQQILELLKTAHV